MYSIDNVLKYISMFMVSGESCMSLKTVVIYWIIYNIIIINFNPVSERNASKVFFVIHYKI